MAGEYAKNTQVSVAKSKLEIEKTLVRYGATGFYSGWQESPPASSIGFALDGRTMRIDMPMPDIKSREFTHDHNNYMRSKDKTREKWEQAQRQRWRALLLIIKAKLEYIECELSTVDKEFMADVILPNGQRVADVVLDKIADAYLTGKMPMLLPAYGGDDDQ